MNEFLERLRKNIYFPFMGIKDLKELGDNYSEEQIRQLAIKGAGTNEDPLIIDGSTELPRRFMISNCTLFINIVNCQFVNITVDKCKNISFNRCSFEVLGILRSSSIITNQSLISLLGLGQSSNIHFRECTINNGFNLNNHSNSFIDCIFSRRSSKTFQKEFNFNLSKLIRQLPYFIIVYGIVMISYFLISGLNSIPLGTEWIYLFGILVILTILYWLLTKSVKKGAIKKKENKSTTLRE